MSSSKKLSGAAFKKLRIQRNQNQRISLHQLTSLSILSIEYDIANSLIDDFASSKARKINLNSLK